MEIETQRYESVVSFYAYGLAGRAVLTLISPLIVLSVPLVALLGPPATAWWLGRNRAPRVGSIMLGWLSLVSVLIFLAPLLPGVWFIASRESGPPTASFWLIVTALLLAPFPLLTVTYRHRVRTGRSAWTRSAGIHDRSEHPAMRWSRSTQNSTTAERYRRWARSISRSPSLTAVAIVMLTRFRAPERWTCRAVGAAGSPSSPEDTEPFKQAVASIPWSPGEPGTGL